MTEEEKDILIAKMLDQDSSLTDEDLALISHDDELTDILKVSSAVRGASILQTNYDLDREWRLFRHRILPKPSPRRWMMRVAAVFLGVLIVSAVVKFAIDKTFTSEKQAVVVDSKVQTLPVNSVQVISLPGESLVENNEDSWIHGTAVSQPPPKRNKKRIKSNQITIKESEPKKEIDVDEYLRNMQEEIDDQITRLQAEVIVDEAIAMETPLDYPTEESGKMESEINYTSMP